MTTQFTPTAKANKPSFRASTSTLLASLAVIGWSTILAPQGVLAQTQDTNAPRSLAATCRAVRVIASRGSLFKGALAAKQTIDLKGNNPLIDSYNSSDPTKSTNGQYDQTKAGDAGNILTDEGITNSMNVGNANIYGKVNTGPGGAVGIGPNGAIGAHSWQTGNSGIESGWLSQDANFTFPDVTLPFSSGLTPASGNIVTTSTTVTTNTLTSTTYPSPTPTGGVTTNIVSSTTVSTYPSPVPYGLTTNVTTWNTNSSKYPSPDPGNVTTITTVDKNGHISTIYVWPTCTYTYPNLSFTYSLFSTNTGYTTNFYNNILYSGDYYSTSLSGSTIVLGTARLVLPNGLNMGGQDSLTVATGAGLSLYCGGTSVGLSGNAVFNQTGLPANFVVYCTPTVTSLTLSGNAAFEGVLVAPSADVNLKGGGTSASPTDFDGAVMANTITLNGHFNIHYDEALNNLKLNIPSRFLVTFWTEINPGS
jgi:hypothetical protein